MGNREDCVEMVGDDELMFMDGFDDCIAGIVYGCNQQTVVCYDVDRVLKKLENDGMTHEEAREYMDFNQVGAYMGDRTPLFLEPLY